MPLGCATTYDAAIHLQGGGRLWTRVDGVTDLSWGRKLDDTAEATITVAKSLAGSECCGRLGDTRTWSHELTLYRDGWPVFQGPIISKSEKRTEIEFEARDLLAWWDHRAIQPRKMFPDGWAPAPGEENEGYPVPGRKTQPTPPMSHYHYWQPYDCGMLISGLVRDAFWPLSNMDPGMWAYSYWWQKPWGTPVQDWIGTGTTANTDLLHTGTTTVGEVAREVIKSGVDMFTVGRRIYVLPEREAKRAAPYRLRGSDFLDDLEVRENGADAATRGFVVGGQPVKPGDDATQDPAQPGSATSWDDQYVAPIRGVFPPGGGWIGGDGQSIGQTPPDDWPDEEPYRPRLGDPMGGVDPAFGLLDKISESDNTVDETSAAGMAQSARTHGFPPPVAVIVPDNAQLSPEAPVEMDQLVPGRTFLIGLDDYCTPLFQEFRLNELEVTWTSDGVEQVAVSFVSKNPPPNSDGSLSS